MGKRQKSRRRSVSLVNNNSETSEKVDENLKRIYLQQIGRKASHTALETIYETASVETKITIGKRKIKRLCQFGEFYYPSKTKLNLRKNSANKLRMLGVKVPSGKEVSVTDVHLALSCLDVENDSNICNIYYDDKCHNIDIYTATSNDSNVELKDALSNITDVSTVPSEIDSLVIQSEFVSCEKPLKKVTSETSRKSKDRRRSGSILDFCPVADSFSAVNLSNLPPDDDDTEVVPCTTVTDSVPSVNSNINVDLNEDNDCAVIRSDSALSSDISVVSNMNSGKIPSAVKKNECHIDVNVDPVNIAVEKVLGSNRNNADLCEKKESSFYPATDTATPKRKSYKTHSSSNSNPLKHRKSRRNSGINRSVYPSLAEIMFNDFSPSKESELNEDCAKEADFVKDKEIHTSLIASPVSSKFAGSSSPSTLLSHLKLYDGDVVTQEEGMDSSRSRRRRSARLSFSGGSHIGSVWVDEKSDESVTAVCSNYSKCVIGPNGLLLQQSHDGSGMDCSSPIVSGMYDNQASIRMGKLFVNEDVKQTFSLHKLKGSFLK